jgi:hypothetical protein
MRHLLTSKFFLAIIAFGALSLFAGACNFCWRAPTDYPYRSWTAWAIDDFLQRKQTPNIVFLGSSLVLVPIAGVDADYLGKRLDGSAHHNSMYFERALTEKTGIAASTYNFALPGEMPSDACMITKFLLKDQHAPKVVIYGVGPRDFMDNLLPSPASTDPFRFLSRFGDITAWAGLMMPDWFDRMNFEAGRFVYLYGHKTDIADKLAVLAGGPLNLIAALPLNAKPFSHEELVKLLPEYRPFELQRGEAFFRPSTAADHAQFVDNLEEYRKRYKKLKVETFRTQMRFFDQTLAAAREHGSHAVVVAMPITDVNRQLLPDSSWNAYRSNIQEVARKNGASFIDFNTDTSFVRANFGDTVHLHSGGGKLWLDKLAEKLAADAPTTAALKSDPLIARRKGGAL